MTHDEPTYQAVCTFLRESEKAVLIEIQQEEMWIPLSQVREMHKPPSGEGRIVMTAWIAKQKHLI